MTYITEKHIQQRYKSSCICATEVSTPVGKIDVLTSDELIEIKDAGMWKQGVGQLMAYSFFYPNHVRVLHLYRANCLCKAHYRSNELRYAILKICNYYNIKVIVERPIESEFKLRIPHGIDTLTYELEELIYLPGIDAVKQQVDEMEVLNREIIIRNYLRYEEEQEKLRIQLDKEQSVINKYHIN